MDYVLDRNGHRVFPGDYVECATTQYDSIRHGERRRVQAIEGGCIVLRNGFSPRGTSPYRPSNFIVAGRYQPDYKYKEATMLHIAIEIGFAIFDFEQMAASVNDNTVPTRLMADTSPSALKERIKVRLAAHPDEKWLILSGNTIGERADPPVRFRSI